MSELLDTISYHTCEESKIMPVTLDKSTSDSKFKVGYRVYMSVRNINGVELARVILNVLHNDTSTDAETIVESYTRSDVQLTDLKETFRKFYNDSILFVYMKEKI